MKTLKTTTTFPLNAKPHIVRLGLIALIQNDGFKVGIPNRPKKMGEYDDVNSWVVEDLTELLALPKRLGSKIDVMNEIASYSDHEVEDGKMKMGKIAQKYWFDAEDPIESTHYAVSISARPFYKHNMSDGSYTLSMAVSVIKAGEPYATKVKDLPEEETVVIDGIVFE